VCVWGGAGVVVLEGVDAFCCHLKLLYFNSFTFQEIIYADMFNLVRKYQMTNPPPSPFFRSLIRKRIIMYSGTGVLISP
jgi:hypothetical protein